MFGERTKLPSSSALCLTRTSWHHDPTRNADAARDDSFNEEPGGVENREHRPVQDTYSHCHPDQPCKPRI
jgi:hypothetical protein